MCLCVCLLFCMILRFSTQTVMSSVISDSFISFILVCMSFISFSCFIELVKIFSRIMNSNGESKYPCSVPDLRVEGFLPLSMMFPMDGLLTHNHFEEIAFYSQYAKCFCYEWVLKFVKCILCFDSYDHMVFILQSINIID